MLLIVALSVLGVVTVGSVVAYQRGAVKRMRELGKLGREPLKALPPGPVDEPPAAERTLETLRIGDVILQSDRDWIIVGTLAYREEDERWWLHRVEDEGEVCWFEVRQRDGEWTAAFLVPATDIPDFGQLYDGLTHRGMPYRLWRRGDARLRVEGDVEGRVDGVVHYACYEGPGEGVLNIDELSEGGRVSLSGDRLVTSGIDLMPGS